MKQAELLRKYVMNRLCTHMAIYISCLPEREDEALRRLGPAERADTFARIADAALKALGHNDTGDEVSYRTQRSARKQVAL